MAAGKMAKHFGSEGYGARGAKKPKPAKKAVIVNAPKPKPSQKDAIIPGKGTSSKPQTVMLKDAKGNVVSTAKIQLVDGKVRVVGNAGARAQSAAARARRRNK